MKIFKLLLLIGLVPFYAKTQNQLPAGKLNVNTTPGVGIIEEIKEEQSTDIQGNHYLYEEWHQGNITLKNGHQMKNIDFRYNLKTHQIELKSSNRTQVIHLNNIYQFEIPQQEKSQLFLSYTSLKSNRAIYGIFEVLSKGKIQLLRKPLLKLQRADYVPTHNVGNKNDMYIQAQEFYIIQNQELISVKAKKKNILSLLHLHEEEIALFVKKHQLHCRKIEDLKKIFDFYNQLVQ